MTNQQATYTSGVNGERFSRGLTASYTAIGVAVGLFVVALIALLFRAKLAFGALSSLSVLSLGVALVLAIVFAIVDGRAQLREQQTQKVWLLNNYGSILDDAVAQQLVQGKPVYINDNGTTRDEVRFVYRADMQGHVLQFTTVSAPRLTPTPVA